MEKSPNKTSKPYNLISAIVAFCMWGAWAFYINYETSPTTGAISGLTQGSASFLITLAIVRSVTFISNQLNSFISKLFLPAIITVAFTSSCLIIAHLAVETPNILTTITPGLTVAFVFCVFTSHTLNKPKTQN